MFVVLFKNLGLGSWMFAGPYGNAEEAQAVCLNSLPKQCDGTLLSMNDVAVALGKTPL